MVGGFLNSTPAVVPSAYPDPALVIVPANPATVNVAVALTVGFPPVKATFAYVPAAYPDPAVVIVPVIDWISIDSVAPVPAPPTIVRVGALV